MMSESGTVAPATKIDLERLDVDALDSVALKRIIEEVRTMVTPPQGQATAYNRTYHRHNR